MRIILQYISLFVLNFYVVDFVPLLNKSIAYQKIYVRSWICKFIITQWPLYTFNPACNGIKLFTNTEILEI
jgi:hypothetical protein